MNPRVKTFLAAGLLMLGAAASSAEPSLDSERLNLEMRMQQRVEEALSKILPPGQFVIVIRVEPIAPVAPAAAKAEPEGFFLPGVPARRALSDNGEQVRNLVESLKPDNTFQRFIKKIMVTLVVDKDISEETIERVRELTRQMMSLDAARGDTLDVQRTAFNKPGDQAFAPTGIQRVQRELKSYWVIISLALILFCIMIFILFMFGPLRAFLNKFVQVLPTLRPEDNSRMRAMYEAQQVFAPQQPQQALPQPGGLSSFSGSLQVENPNKTVLPFGFVREDHLGNLAILLSRESPEKAAIVLGYLPPDWISRVLGRLEPSMQSEVASCLATTRQLLPEQVEDIEQDLKRRLDYLIGGPDRIIAVYESLDTDAQRRMLDSLKESRPELAEELRHRTMLFEDLEKLEAPALKALMREVDLQTLVLALRGITAGFRTRFIEALPEGKAQIVKEELEVEGNGGKAAVDAQRKVVAIAKRLEREGQIIIPQIDSPAIPAARYGGSLRSSLKLPTGLQLDASPTDDTAPPPLNPTEGDSDIRERIKKFMKRGTPPGGESTGTGG